MEYQNKSHLEFTRVLEIIGNKWNLFIIWSLKDGTLRFTELQRRMNYVNSKTVTKHLRDLEKSKIVTRLVYPEVPPRVEYTLTEQGLAFLPVFEAIRKWGETLF
ncbi:MAG: helix-turn-helix domain-containing protein [Candidatus Bathyarchaeia archaeon]